MVNKTVLRVSPVLCSARASVCVCVCVLAYWLASKMCMFVCVCVLPVQELWRKGELEVSALQSALGGVQGTFAAQRKGLEGMEGRLRSQLAGKVGAEDFRVVMAEVAQLRPVKNLCLSPPENRKTGRGGDTNTHSGLMSGLGVHHCRP